MSRLAVARTISAFLAGHLAACSGGATSPELPETATPSADTSIAESTEPSAATADFVLVAIGDSIPFNLEGDCPGCTGFVDSYGVALESEVGEPIAVLNRSRHDGARTIDILEQLQSDENLVAELATADVIVMSVGFNDQPPFFDAHPGCPAPPADVVSEVVEAGAATSTSCIDSVVPLIRDQIADVFGRLRAAAPDAAIGALTAYDSWRGWPALDEVDPATREDLYAAVTYWLQEWNAALCEEAEAVGAVCVDVYHAFNGPDGTAPPGELVAADHTHPSQQGNDVIHDLLVDAALTDHIDP